MTKKSTQRAGRSGTASSSPTDDATECNRADERLLTAQSMLAEAQAVAHLGSWAYDFSTDRLIWSDETYRIFGVDPATFVPSYQTFVARIHPDDRAAFEKDFADAVANREVLDVEHRILLDDGTTRYVRERGRMYYDAEGRPTRSVGTVQDISDRKKVETSLKRSEMLLANALALTRAAPWEYDVRSNLFTFNDSFYAIYGTTAAEVGGYQMAPEAYAARFVHPDDIPVVAGETQIALETSDPNYNRELEHRFFYANGETGILAVRIRVLHDESGRTIKTYGVNQDITRLKKMERELTLSKALNSTAVECSVEGILIVDNDMNIISHNHVFVEMWQVPKWLMGSRADESLLEFVAGQVKDPHGFIARVTDLYAHPGETAHDQVELKDGRIFARDSVPLYDENGKYLARAWFFRDVTERFRAEQELRESEENFRAIFASVREGIFVIDPENGKFVEVNDSGCRMFGYAREEVLGSDIGLLSSGEAPYTLDDALERMHGPTDTAEEFDWHCKAQGGRLFWGAVAAQDATFRGRTLLLVTVRDITARKTAEATIADMARHDALTGLANRRVFVEQLERAIAQARRSKSYLAVLYLDLDHFKDVNDTLGHPVGDLLLQEVGDRLRANVRDVDTVARFGGDEFAVIMADLTNPDDAAVLAEKLLKVLSDPYILQGNEIRSGTSIGIATYGADSPDAESLLTHADVALYRAKVEERGTFRFFTDDMDREVRARVSLASELRIAVSQDQLVLFYQPEADLDSGRIIGVEALIRWKHPKRGLIGPDEFIPVAEKSGLIVDLGRWVMRKACRQARAWMDMQIAPGFVAINLSALQFKRPEVLKQDIFATLAETRLPAKKLEIELTETVIMDASRRYGAFLQELRHKGVRIAIDDFGTGYSSLDYLRRFPVDRIKIAQNFVSDLESEKGNQAIVRAALGLARELDLGAVAEGIETLGQLLLLKSWGCREGQGNYFARPLPVDEMTKLLRQRCGLYASAESANECNERGQGRGRPLGTKPRTSNVRQ